MVEGFYLKEIKAGSLVVFLDIFQSETIPNVGIVLSIVTFPELVYEELGEGVVWYSVLFGDVDMVVSSEMIILIN